MTNAASVALGEQPIQRFMSDAGSAVVVDQGKVVGVFTTTGVVGLLHQALEMGLAAK